MPDSKTSQSGKYHHSSFVTFQFAGREIKISPHTNTVNHYPAAINLVSVKTQWRRKMILWCQKLFAPTVSFGNLRIFHDPPHLFYLVSSLSRASSGGVSRAMQPTPAPVRKTAWSTAPAATAASTAGCRSAWQWECHEMVSGSKGRQQQVGGCNEMVWGEGHAESGGKKITKSNQLFSFLPR